MQDLPASKWSDLVRPQCFDCQCASVRIHELDLVALPLVMNEDNGPHVAGQKAVRRKVLEQRHCIQFLQRLHDRATASTRFGHERAD